MSGFLFGAAGGSGQGNTTFQQQPSSAGISSFQPAPQQQQYAPSNSWSQQPKPQYGQVTQPQMSQQVAQTGSSFSTHPFQFIQECFDPNSPNFRFRVFNNFLLFLSYSLG